MGKTDDSPAGSLKEYAKHYTELDDVRRQIMGTIAEEAASEGVPEEQPDDPCFNGND
jgi:hypothetical protein